jgi:hypothetical protein
VNGGRLAGSPEPALMELRGHLKSGQPETFPAPVPPAPDVPDSERVKKVPDGSKLPHFFELLFRGKSGHSLVDSPLEKWLVTPFLTRSQASGSSARQFDDALGATCPIGFPIVSARFG